MEVEEAREDVVGAPVEDRDIEAVDAAREFMDEDGLPGEVVVVEAEVEEEGG